MRFHSSLLLVLCCVLLSACKKEEQPDEPTPPSSSGGGNEATGEDNPGESKVFFWTRMRMFNQYNCYLEVNGSSRLFDYVFTSSNSPTSCNSTSGESFTLAPGTYSYSLSNSSQGISWNGQFSLLQDQCKIIEIVEPPGMWGKGKLLVYASNIIGSNMKVQVTSLSSTYVLDQEYNSAPVPFSNGTFSRYMAPGSYTLRAYDGNGSPGALIGQANFTISAGQLKVIEVYE